MEDRLKNLKNILDTTIIKDRNLIFNEQHKKEVLRAIKTNSSNTTKTKKISRRIHLLASVGLTGSLLVGTYYIAGIDEIISNNEINIPNGNTYSKDNKIINSKNSEETTNIVPTVQKENYKEMTKEEIYQKILSIDKFETAQGEYDIQNVSYDGTKSISNVKYSLSLTPIRGGYSIESYNQVDSVTNTITYYKDDKLWTLFSDSKTYRENKYINGGRPPIAQNSLFPREITLNYLKNLDSWEIEKQNEEFINHNTIVIKGTLNDYATVKHSAKTFRFWVDKDTGVLLKYETYNDNEEVVSFLNTKELQINVPIDTKSFTPNIEGYQKLEREKLDET